MKVSAEVLESLRPDPVALDPRWSHETLSQILRAERPTKPSRQRSRSRLVVAVFVAVIVSVSGVGLASAGGLMPQAFIDVFSPRWDAGPIDGHPPVDPATAVRAASAPGPDGTVFTVMSTGTDAGYACRTALIETAESAAGPGPASFTDITSSFCSDSPSGSTFGLTDVSYQDVAAGFIVSAGTAVRAEVHTKGGREYPALLVHGDFWGWFPTTSRPTLVAYAADGTVVGRARLY